MKCNIRPAYMQISPTPFLKFLSFTFIPVIVFHFHLWPITPAFEITGILANVYGVFLAFLFIYLTLFSLQLFNSCYQLPYKYRISDRMERKVHFSHVDVFGSRRIKKKNCRQFIHNYETTIEIKKKHTIHHLYETV